MKASLSRIILVLFFIVNSTFVYAASQPFGPTKKDAMITKLVTSRLKNLLENGHYKVQTINDEVSVKAFNEFIERLDYGKQFFLSSDIAKLKKFERNIDDEIVAGRLFTLEAAVNILKERVSEVKKYSKDIFKSKFDFTKKESFQTDPEKRNHYNSKEDLKEHWRKVLKQAVLSRYVLLLENQEEEKKAKVDKKDKKKKIAKEDSLKGLSKKDLMKKAHKYVKKNYKIFFDRLEKNEFIDYFEMYVNSVNTIFDPHTVYFPPKKKKDFDIEMSGSLEGIGAILSEDPPYIKVVEVVPGGAAWRQKDLEAGDRIIAVGQGSKEPISLIDMQVDDAVTYIRGKKGTEVRLTVKKLDGSVKVIPIIRDVVETGASFAKSSIIKSKKHGVRVGYIKLPRFYRDFRNSKSRNCSDDVKKELITLKKNKVDAVILDLRGNGGGALEDAQNMSGLFIKTGPIVQVRSRMGQVETLVDHDPSVTYDGPLIVMVNRASASASEILAAAMQDYKRAIIVGTEYTHGKGTVQMVLDLNRDAIMSFSDTGLGALKLTLQKFYRVNGGSTQFKGVTPDIFLPDIAANEKNREQDDKNALAWDEIEGVKYKKWNDFPYNINKLKKDSEKRIAKNKKYIKINQFIEHLRKTKEDSISTINLADTLERKEINKKMVDGLKLDEINDDFVISHFETALKFDNKKKKVDKKLWEEDFKRRKSEWFESIKKDYDLEEAINIANDMIKAKS